MASENVKKEVIPAGPALSERYEKLVNDWLEAFRRSAQTGASRPTREVTRTELDYLRFCEASERFMDWWQEKLEDH